MPHNTYTRNLGRSRSWRKATVRSLAQAVIKYERIETTLARAKEAQRLVERLITLGKGGSLPERRRAISMLNDQRLVGRLFTDVAPRFSTRMGGYTRILHQGFRPGDGASLAVLELVELAPKTTEKPKGKEKVAEKGPRVKAEKAAPASATEVAEPEKPLKSEVKKDPKKDNKKQDDKSKGFIGGLRDFFKGRPNQP